MQGSLCFCVKRRRGFHGYNQVLSSLAIRGWPLFLLRSEETHLCPKCGTELCRSGWRKRTVIASDGISDIYWIRRLYCSKCRKIHHELPDFIVPYKRYHVHVIENILEGTIADIPCYDSTMRLIRWWFSSISESLLRLMDSKYTCSHWKRKDISSLQKIKKAYGNGKGWLSNAMMHLVKSGYYVKTTRFLC